MFIAIRSIPLSQETRAAWASAGVKIARRNRTESEIFSLAEKMKAEGIVNLGNLDHMYTNSPVTVFNKPVSVRFVSHPAALRRNMGTFIPANDRSGPHWHKAGGYGGEGKTFHKSACTDSIGVIQKHVEGEEFRVITVGDRIVQAHRKELLDGIGNFEWHWAGVEGIRKNGIIPHVKAAISQVPGSMFTVFGWDIIVANKNEPYTIEINTSPGVNELTAGRIVAGMRFVLEGR